jgi:hypothetical protein
MRIDDKNALALCNGILEGLIEWPTFPAVLQLGGIEMRASSRIQAAMEGWLSSNSDGHLLVVPEYRLMTGPDDSFSLERETSEKERKSKVQRIDYALVERSSVGEARLKVATVIEVKSNYLGQKDLGTRPLSACNQAFEYASRCKAEFSYVIYIVAAVSGPRPDKPFDAGWGYFLPNHGPSEPDALMKVRGTKVVAKASTHNTSKKISLPKGKADIWVFLLERAA